MNRAFLRIVQPIILAVVVGIFYLLFRDSFATAKVIHLLALISWFAGLFYLPRLFVYHAMTDEDAVDQNLKIMEHKLFYYIMTPAMVLTLLAGFWMVELWQWTMPGWLHSKLGLVLLLVIYHYQCWRYLNMFKSGNNQKSHTYYRIFNEIPTLLLIGIVVLVVVKPAMNY
ncbi:MAG: protoporphyrinogen oxidase HemJ [Gammaproteobacteria bacterium]|uniref:Protoporphyrinogen IX oxidase n=1 Tax=Candidatus Thiopontia autotrophica TaxID=2841688 RepID=A0A8J6P9N7_9GAMM|nr:protoporphyrinogen oxidase HemJ [Candidatus Thiopontia autotrophica]MBL6969674.1 protoporphyrinogen oxidase HemJ [Gammaproteobacteria bacterium]